MMRRAALYREDHRGCRFEKFVFWQEPIFRAPAAEQQFQNAGYELRGKVGGTFIYTRPA